MKKKHTIRRSENRYNKASPLSKTASSFQKKINSLAKQLEQSHISNKLKKIQLSNFSKLIDYLIKENRVTKEEIKRFLTTRKQEIEKMKVKIE